MTKNPKNMELPDISQQAVEYIDATPNEDYPLRILKSYRQRCDCNWASVLNHHPLIQMMNKQNVQRAEILDRAITILEKYYDKKS